MLLGIIYKIPHSFPMNQRIIVVTSYRRIYIHQSKIGLGYTAHVACYYLGMLKNKSLIFESFQLRIHRICTIVFAKVRLCTVKGLVHLLADTKFQYPIQHNLSIILALSRGQSAYQLSSFQPKNPKRGKNCPFLLCRTWTAVVKDSDERPFS